MGLNYKRIQHQKKYSVVMSQKGKKIILHGFAFSAIDRRFPYIIKKS